MGRSFSSLERHQALIDMAAEAYDILVIGGGITGAGIALDCASRGLSTALIEMQDFASGTSSRSTKLIHGGLRYLKQLEFSVVAKVGKERAIVYENGPHVTTPEWMLLPIYKGGTFGRRSTAWGLRLYDALAGVKRAERRSMLSAQDTLKREPLLNSAGLLGGGLYVEYRTDDARLTLEVLKKAAELGAAAVNYVRADSFIYDEGQVCGVEAYDLIQHKPFQVKAQHIVNATGPWVDELRQQDERAQDSRLCLTKGVHLVFDHTVFPLRQALYFDVPDGRMLFAIPRAGKTYLGTTDTEYEGDKAQPHVNEEDVSYLLGAVNAMFPQLKLTTDQIESSWAGLRPLIYQAGKAPSNLSRKDEIFTSPSGLISIAGGKLTGYRHMAEEVVNRIVQERYKRGLDQRIRSCRTKTLPISGGDVGGSRHYRAFIESHIQMGIDYGLTQEEAARLLQRYGSNIEQLYNLIAACRPKHNNYKRLPFRTLLELEYSIRYEMAWTPADFFMRRTGQMLFDVHAVQAQQGEVLRYMGDALSWSEQQRNQYVQELAEQLHALKGWER